jgi:hypothetical protein
METDEKPKFTMQYEQFIQLGYTWSKIKKVRSLPKGEDMLAIAGIWGEPALLRCIFERENGELLMRTGYWSPHRYLIKELGLTGKDLEVGAIYHVKRK